MDSKTAYGLLFSRLRSFRLPILRLAYDTVWIASKQKSRIENWNPEALLHFEFRSFTLNGDVSVSFLCNFFAYYAAHATHEF